MGFNPNDPAFVQQLLRLDAPNIQATLRRLNVADLDSYQPEHPVLYDCKVEVMRTTKTLSFSIGRRAQYVCRESKLWHPFECELAQFPGGMYPTMHQSYLGFYDQFSHRDSQAILNDYPNIETLNLMVDLGNAMPPDVMQDTVNNVVRLIQTYAPRLVTFRLWFKAPTFVVVEGTTAAWHSTLRHQFVPNLWPALDAMVHCRVLWLELEEEALPVILPVIVPRRQVLPLENYLQGRITLRNMTQLQEFRFSGELFDPYNTMAERLFPLANLRRIYIKNRYNYRRWTNVQDGFVDRFQEINITFDGLALLQAGQVPLEAAPVHGHVSLNELVRQMSRFHALTRIGIHLGQAGLRLITVLQPLSHLPNLQSLYLIVQQPTLFSPQEAATMRNRPVQLASLQVCMIIMDINLRAHEAISMAVLPFPGREPWQWAPENSPLPSLVCFGMIVREGNCFFCPGDRTGQDNCIRQAVIRWFEPLANARPRPPIAKVYYCNLEHRTLNGQHELTGNITPQPRGHPILLEE